jgi:energy-coupling factor transport system permease protein
MIQIKYFPGNTFVHRLDPRTKFLLVTLFIFTEVAFLDIRILVFPFVASILLYLSAKIPFKEVKGTWKFLLTIIVLISSINAFFTFLGVTVPNPHIIAKFWIFKITVEGIFFAVASIMRFLSLAIVSFCVVMTTDPGLYAPALSKLGMPYKGAFVVDLSLRYLPVYVDELETTMNAQMARGFKAKARGGLLARILNTVPLLVPVAINAMLSIYDVADAMELRAFGAEKKRTWYRTVSFKRRDYVSIVSLFSLLILAIFLRTRFTTYWIPS